MSDLTKAYANSRERADAAATLYTDAGATRKRWIIAAAAFAIGVVIGLMV